MLHLLLSNQGESLGFLDAIDRENKQLLPQNHMVCVR